MIQQKLHPKIAEKLIPNYEDCPNIDKTGSLKGMKKQYGWKIENCIQVGDYIYNISNHPRFKGLEDEATDTVLDLARSCQIDIDDKIDSLIIEEGVRQEKMINKVERYLTS